MAGRAQPRQERSRQRRDALLSAAVELFADGGSRAVTHRAVAAHAGLPPASTTYYFTSIDDLLREALADHVTRWRDEVDLLAGFDAPSRHPTTGSTVRVIEEIFARRGPDVAGRELAILLAVSRDDALRDQAKEAMEHFEQLAVRWLTLLGVPDAERVAPGMVALIAGTALRRQTGRYSELEEARLLGESLRDLVGAHLHGRRSVDRLIADTTGRQV